MKTKMLLHLFAFCFLFAAANTAMASESISLSTYFGNSYTISPNQSTNSIRFDFTATGLSNDLYYGWDWRLDGGSWSSVNNIGFGGSGTYTSYFSVGLGAGSHTVDIRLLRYDNPPGLWAILSTASSTVTLTQQYSITVQNSFGGGNVKVDGQTYASGSSFTWNSGSTHSLEAIDSQTSGGYNQRFNDWSGPQSGTNITLGITVGGNDTYSANFKKEFNITFQNSLPGTSGGVIKVNGAQYNAPASSFVVRQDNTITGEGLYQVIDNIEYTFSSWSPGGSTSASTTFTPGDHTTYTANFNAKPTATPNVSVGGTVGSPVQISWSDHPNEYVNQYQIWRVVQPHGGSPGSPQLIATVNRGTTSCTDNLYRITSSWTDYLLSYDVRSHYSVANSYSDPVWYTLYGRDFDGRIARNEERAHSREADLPTETRVSNYPNPFNPSTTISYQLVEDANVSLIVYDLMGRRIVSLVEGQKSVGYHSVQWNGRDTYGNPVSTGIYLYRFVAVPSSGRPAVLILGKLLLAK
jgi:hypothetical protein